MPTYTPNMGLIKPTTGEKVNIDQLNANFDKLDNSSPYVCTSTTRPPSPYLGMLIYETDTKWTRYWEGTFWLPLNPTVMRFNNYGVPGLKPNLKISEGSRVMEKVLFPKLDFPCLMEFQLNWTVELKPKVNVDVKLGASSTIENYNRNTEAGDMSAVIIYGKNHDIGGTNSTRRYGIVSSGYREVYPTAEIWGFKVSAQITANGDAGTSDALVSVNEYGYMLQISFRPFSPDSTKIQTSSNENA